MAATITATTYAIPHDVRDFLLMRNVTLDVNSTPAYGTVERYISDAEGELDELQSFRPRFIQNEVKNLTAWRGAYQDFPQWFVPRPVKLNHDPILPFDTNRGHKIEVYEGQDTVSTANPEGLWTEYVGTKTQGRANDFWFDAEKGMVEIRKTFLFRQYKLFRISYEHGKPITTLTSSVNTTDTTIPVASTYRYEARGYIRIGTEWIFHTGKTTASFTGCVRAQRNTEARAFDSGSEVYEVPDYVWSNVVKRASALYLSNEGRFITTLPAGSDTSPNHKESIEMWNKEWKDFLKRFQKFRLVT